MSKLVSIVIPMYNAERTIQKCVESIIEQSYKEIEVVVVDDGSEDTSAEKVKAFGRNVKYIYQENEGVSAARNRGIREAKGEYLLFVDSDDCIDKDFIEKTLHFAEEKNLDMVIARHTETNATIYGGNENTECSFTAVDDSDIVRHFKSIHVGQAVGKLYRLQIIRDNEILFPIKMNLAEDFYFVSEVLLYTNRVGLVDNTYYRVFNVNADSLSKRCVPNIQCGIEMQLDIWKRLSARYSGLDVAYAEDDMDFKLHKVKMYSNNLFRRGAENTFTQAVGSISRFIKNKPELFRGNLSIKYCPNNVRRIESIIIKSKSSVLIAVFYCMKEELKALKIRKIHN